MIKDKLKELTIQEKFRVVEATNIYPDFHTSLVKKKKNFNIDDDWYKRVSEAITEEILENILNNYNGKEQL